MYERSLSTMTIRACSLVLHTMNWNGRVMGLAYKMDPRVRPNCDYSIGEPQKTSWAGITWLYCGPTFNYQYLIFFDQLES